MISITEVLDRIIERAPFLEEALDKNLINLSQLAREILPEIEKKTKKEVTVGAILMSLKRHKVTRANKSSKISDIINKLGDVTVRSNLTEFTFSNSSSLVDKQQKLFHLIEENREIFCNVSSGVTETTIIASLQIAERLKNIYHNEELITQLKNLSSITIKLPPENLTTPGVYYTILKHLAWENINIIESFSTTNELTLIFYDQDIERAFSVLKGLKV